MDKSSVETTTISVVKLRDQNGEPTCRWGKNHCPFLWYSVFGTREHCFWRGSNFLIERRDDGSGTTVPHSECPVWEMKHV
jgi:hypothetical protein